MDRRRNLLLIGLLTLLTGVMARAGDVSVTGDASVPPQSVVFSLYLRTELGDEPAAEKQLDENWASVRRWLNNLGIKDEQIIVGDPQKRLFHDQKRFLIRRVTITMPLPAGDEDQRIEELLRLLDQASGRGLLPASQLLILSGQIRDFLESVTLDTTSHFVFFLPPDAQQLEKQAMEDAVARLRRQRELTEAILGRPVRVNRLKIMQGSPRTTDLHADRLGTASVDSMQVRATAQIVAELQPTIGEKTQVVTVTGSAAVPMKIERAIVQTRLVASNASFIRAGDEMADQVRLIEQLVAAGDGMKLHLGGICFFSGYMGPFPLADLGEGQVPAGIYRDVRVEIGRRPDESEAAFRTRVEDLAQAVAPRAFETIENTESPFVLALWGPHDLQTPYRQAIELATADAARAARHSVQVAGGKLGPLQDIHLPEVPTLP